VNDSEGFKATVYRTCSYLHLGHVCREHLMNHYKRRLGFFSNELSYTTGKIYVCRPFRLDTLRIARITDCSLKAMIFSRTGLKQNWNCECRTSEFLPWTFAHLRHAKIVNLILTSTPCISQSRIAFTSVLFAIDPPLRTVCHMWLIGKANGPIRHTVRRSRLFAVFNRCHCS